MSLGLTVLFILASLTGWVAHAIWVSHGHTPREPQRVREGGYSFISPLLMCEDDVHAAEGDEREFLLKNAVERLIRNETAGLKLTHVSVYFRDLTNGRSFGINRDERFAPASLLKVPLMMAWLRQAEHDPRLLSRKIEYGKSADDYNDQLNIRPSSVIERGRAYQIDELLYRMIVYSDNNANRLLFDAIDKKLLIETYRALGVTYPIAGLSDDYISVASYASFFRVLFNASYLNRDMSERALSYLSKSEFIDGIVAGVSGDVAVAHKFGERSFDDSSNTHELHDCGIVYYARGPYLLCVMTRGTDFSTLDDIIKDVSRLVYKEVDDRHRSEG